jgi:hypothetical protein
MRRLVRSGDPTDERRYVPPADYSESKHRPEARCRSLTRCPAARRAGWRLHHHAKAVEDGEPLEQSGRCPNGRLRRRLAEDAPGGRL